MFIAITGLSVSLTVDYSCRNLKGKTLVFFPLNLKDFLPHIIHFLTGSHLIFYIKHNTRLNNLTFGSENKKYSHETSVSAFTSRCNEIIQFLGEKMY